MKCPVDESTLIEKQKDDITIRTCPKFKGIWLKRGELNKILAQSEVEYPDIEDFKDRGVSAREHKYKSPGHFSEEYSNTDVTLF